MIVDSLRYWVEEMHVDGLSVRSGIDSRRDESGRLMPSPPCCGTLNQIRAGGHEAYRRSVGCCRLYQVGSFIGTVGESGDGRFRDDVRSFFSLRRGFAGVLADRCREPEIYGHKEREPEESVNFVTCHDGFTLKRPRLLQPKHNEANGEDNRDGTNDNRAPIGVSKPNR